MQEPANDLRQRTSTVREDDPQIRVTFEHTAEDEPRPSQRRLDRVADQIVQVVAAHPFYADDVVWVDQNHQPQLFGPLPERVQRGIVQLDAIEIRRDLDAAQAKLFDCPVQLLQRRPDILQR